MDEKQANKQKVVPGDGRTTLADEAFCIAEADEDEPNKECDGLFLEKTKILSVFAGN